MRKMIVRYALLFIAMFFCFSEFTVAGEEVVPQRWTSHTIPLIEKAPAIDGMVDIEEWTGALELPPLLHLTSGEIDSPRTVGYIVYTKERLFVAWKVYRPENAGPPKMVYTVPGKNQRVSGDDAIELSLNMDRTKTSAVIFYGNAAGIFSDSVASPRVSSVKSFNWNYRARITDFGWEGEASIAFKELGLDATPKPGTVWGFDLVRVNRTPDHYLALLFYRTRWHRAKKYSIRMNSRLMFGGSVPAVRILDAGTIGEDSVGVLAEIINRAGQPADVTVEYQIYRRKDSVSPHNFLEQVDSVISLKEFLTVTSGQQKIDEMLKSYDLIKEDNMLVRSGANDGLKLDMTAAKCSIGGYVISYRFTDAVGNVLASAILPVTKRSPLHVTTIPYYLEPKELYAKAAIYSERVRTPSGQLLISFLKMRK